MKVGGVEGLALLPGPSQDLRARDRSPKRLVQEQFARVLVKQMRSGLSEEAMGGDFGQAFGDIFDEAMARSIVDGGGMEIPWRVQDSQKVQWPVAGAQRVSSGFGMRERHPVHGDRRMHSGLDIPAHRGAEIEPVRSGTVIRVQLSESGYGNQVLIQHLDGMVSRYAHCQQIFVQKGDQVDLGQAIATVGTSGDSTGPHLHLEIHIDGEAVDPMTYMQGQGPAASGNL